MKISDIDKVIELLRDIYFEAFKEIYPNITRKEFGKLLDDIQQFIENLERNNDD